MTKLLTIGFLLFSCEVAAADERHKPGDVWPKGDGCNTCEMDQFGTSSCTVMYCKLQDLYTDCLHKTPDGKTVDICRMPDMRKILSESQSCERKMKEAMKLMDKIMRGEWVHTPYNTYEYQSMVPSAQEQARWESIYKECVK